MKHILYLAKKACKRTTYGSSDKDACTIKGNTKSKYKNVLEIYHLKKFLIECHLSNFRFFIFFENKSGNEDSNVSTPFPLIDKENLMSIPTQNNSSRGKMLSKSNL